jgi:hypothetical protein
LLLLFCGGGACVALRAGGGWWGVGVGALRAHTNDFANTLSAVASTDYGALLPTADIANALLTSVPAYDVSLFLDGLEAGNLLDAVGYPIAADVALVPLIAGLTDYGVIIADATTLSALIP